MESAAMIVWLTPTMMVRFAMGSWTLRSIWARLVPRESIASMVCPDTDRMPCALILMTGGRA
jgi:hypothetical protein